MWPEPLDEGVLSIKRVRSFLETADEEERTDAEIIAMLLVNNGILVDVCRAIVNQEKRLSALEDQA